MSRSSLQRAEHTPLPPHLMEALGALQQALHSFMSAKELSKELSKELGKELSPVTTTSPRPRPRLSGPRRRFCNWNLAAICSRKPQATLGLFRKPVKKNSVKEIKIQNSDFSKRIQ